MGTGNCCQLQAPDEPAVLRSGIGADSRPKESRTTVTRPYLIVKVISLAGLVILKLVSWDDNIERRGKDAADMIFIMKNYITAGNMDRFFEEADILKEEESDYDRSSARFLGREIARMAGQETKGKLIDTLEREAASFQGHKIAMDVLRQDAFQK